MLLLEINARSCSIASSSSGGELLAPWIAVARSLVALTIRSVDDTVGMFKAWCLNFQVSVIRTAPDSSTPLITR